MASFETWLSVSTCQSSCSLSDDAKEDRAFNVQEIDLSKLVNV